MTARERDRKTQRAWRIEQRCRVSPYSFFLSHTSRTTVPVMCLNLGRTYTFHCRRKSQASLEIVGLSCQCLVLFGADLDSLISGSEVRVSGGSQTLFNSGLRRLGDERVH